MTISIARLKPGPVTPVLQHSYTQLLLDSFAEASPPVALTGHTADTGQSWASYFGANANLRVNPTGIVERDATGFPTDIVAMGADAGDTIARVKIRMRNTSTPAKSSQASVGIAIRSGALRGRLYGTTTALVCAIEEYIAGWNVRASASVAGQQALVGNWSNNSFSFTEAGGRTNFDCSALHPLLYCSWAGVSSVGPTDTKVYLYEDTGANMNQCYWRDLEVFRHD